MTENLGQLKSSASTLMVPERGDLVYFLLFYYGA